MKSLIQGKIRSVRACENGIAFMLAILALGSQVFAALGGSSQSVQADQAQMKAKLKTTQAVSYAVHEIAAPTGTVVREYVSPGGRIFGVTWEGPFVPDMRLLLGTYFERYSALAKAQRESRMGRQPLDIREPGLVVQTAGHMRAYVGRAYDPELLPAGVSADDIR